MILEIWAILVDQPFGWVVDLVYQIHIAILADALDNLIMWALYHLMNSGPTQWRYLKQFVAFWRYGVVLGIEAEVIVLAGGNMVSLSNFLL